MHYRRWQRHDDPLVNQRPEQVIGPLEKRFWAKVEKTETCWMWNGYRLPSGYGHFRDDNRTWLAHRLAYTLEVGPIPDGLVIDHLCRVVSCVNPAHLEPVTQRENNHRNPDTQFKRNAAKTHCKSGHPFDEANTRIRDKGNGKTQRVCRTCEAEAWQKHYDRISSDMSQV